MNKIDTTELQKLNILRQSNKEQNAITRECLESALVLLMKEKNFSEISIKDIIKRAGVSRSSYYRNYDSKEDILNGYLDKIINETSRMLSAYDITEDGKDSWLALLRSTRALSKEYKLLLEAGFGDTILRRFINAMERNNPENNEVIHTTNTYLAGCLYATMTQWILDDMTVDDSIIASTCNNLLFHGIESTNIRNCIIEEC